MEGNGSHKALLIFADDGSLAVVRAFADQLEQRGWMCDFMRYVPNSKSTHYMSQRQLDHGLGGRKIATEAIGLKACDERLLEPYDMIALAKYPRPLRLLSIASGWRFRARRPCFVALFPGVELNGPRGVRLRRCADILCVPTRRDAEEYYALGFRHPAWQTVIRYHPALVRKSPLPEPLARQGPVVFFVQSIVPSTLRGRLDVARTIREAAVRNPSREIIIKLRQQTGENRRHAHVEKYGYEWLIEESGGVVDNLTFDDGPAARAIDRASLVITCSSTAGLEALANGVPTLFYLDYIDAAKDPLNTPARRLLEGSGLLASREELLTLKPQVVDEKWAAAVLSEEDDLDRLLEAFEEYRQLGVSSVANLVRVFLAKALVVLDRAIVRR